jgi:TonB family protein
VVNEQGRVDEVKVLRGAHPILDEEAVRVIKSSPLWTPPRQRGRVVRQLFTLPVEFKLQN